jgi:hypothetical protein
MRRYRAEYAARAFDHLLHLVGVEHREHDDFAFGRELVHALGHSRADLAYRRALAFVHVVSNDFVLRIEQPPRDRRAHQPGAYDTYRSHCGSHIRDP